VILKGWIVASAESFIRVSLLCRVRYTGLQPLFLVFNQNLAWAEEKRVPAEQVAQMKPTGENSPPPEGPFVTILRPISTDQALSCAHYQDPNRWYQIKPRARGQTCLTLWRMMKEIIISRREASLLSFKDGARHGKIKLLPTHVRSVSPFDMHAQMTTHKTALQKKKREMELKQRLTAWIYRSNCDS
jgi:hypothetical protein